MKDWTWGLVTAVIAFLIIYVIDIPFWLYILVFAPLLVIALTIFSCKYSFRDSLRMEIIPDSYEDRKRALDKEAAGAEASGFYKTDSFYLKMIPDSVTFVFQHRKEPVYLCIYHFGNKIVMDLISYFDSDLILTTGSSIEGGMIPRPPNRLFQIYESSNISLLFEKHTAAIRFLTSVGRKILSSPPLPFRESFMKSIAEVRAYLQNLPLWPVMLVYWTITKRGKIYCISIEEQHRNGLIKI